MYLEGVVTDDERRIDDETEERGWPGGWCDGEVESANHARPVSNLAEDERRDDDRVMWASGKWRIVEEVVRRSASSCCCCCWLSSLKSSSPL